MKIAFYILSRLAFLAMIAMCAIGLFFQIVGNW